MASKYSGLNFQGDIRNCSGNRAVKLLEHGWKVLEKRLHRIVSVDEMQIGFMPDKGATDAVLVMRKMREEYHAKGKSCICVTWT